MISNASNGFNMEMMQLGLKLRKAMMAFCFHSIQHLETQTPSMHLMAQLSSRLTNFVKFLVSWNRKAASGPQSNVQGQEKCVNKP